MGQYFLTKREFAKGTKSIQSFFGKKNSLEKLDDL